MAVTATAGKSMTSDEIAHLTAGHAYNSRGDFRLQPENGNLPQRWAALPFSAARAPLPPSNLETWQTADVWNYGHAFFYEQGLSSGELLFKGRAMIALFSAATGLLIFFWSRELFGWRGAFLSLLLFVFCPAFLAHGALATSDMVMTFFFLASVGAWWRHLQKPTPASLALSSVLLGLAFVAKFSALLLPPMLGLCGIVWAAGRAKHEGWRKPVAQLARSTLVHAAVTWAVIWAFYGFRFSAFAPELTANATFNHGWGWMLTDMGGAAKVIWTVKEWKLLPEAWLYGLTFVIQFSKARAAFLSGEYGITGWWYFFPFTFLVKTTIPLLAVFLGVFFAGVWRGAKRLQQTGVVATLGWLKPLTPLAALFLVYWITSLTSHLNIGHRHILPTYPVLFICAGWLGRGLDFRRPFFLSAIAVVTALHAVESWRIRPHYLAYFNAFVGGPVNGWRHLVDSSLDWGQDLSGLADWLRAHNGGPAAAPVFLSYFGTGEPAYEGIQATRLPSLPAFRQSSTWAPLTAGIYCVSATMLQQVYSNQHTWTVALEREFQELRASEPLFLEFQNDPARRAKFLADFPAERWQQVWKRYDALRLARLCYYLRVRAADAQVGYSILIYRLSPEEIAAAARDSIGEWSALIERTITGQSPAPAAR